MWGSLGGDAGVMAGNFFCIVRWYQGSVLRILGLGCRNLVGFGTCVFVPMLMGCLWPGSCGLGTRPCGLRGRYDPWPAIGSGTLDPRSLHLWDERCLLRGRGTGTVWWGEDRKNIYLLAPGPPALGRGRWAIRAGGWVIPSRKGAAALANLTITYAP